jgi:hypothetical protein
MAIGDSSRITANIRRIRDADVALEVAASVRLQLMRQVATSQLSQANSAPQIVLSLFQYPRDPGWDRCPVPGTGPDPERRSWTP